MVGIEARKCAPENWIARVPVRYFRQRCGAGQARYTPRNLRNSIVKRGPRDQRDWIPKATYAEPPFTLRQGTSAYTAAALLAEESRDTSKFVHMLHLLSCVYRCMGDKDCGTDAWYHKRGTVASMQAIHRYKENIALFQNRWKGRPKTPRAIKALFKSDSEIRTKLDAERRNLNCPKAALLQTLPIGITPRQSAPQEH